MGSGSRDWWYQVTTNNMKYITLGVHMVTTHACNELEANTIIIFLYLVLLLSPRSERICLFLGSTGGITRC